MFLSVLDFGFFSENNFKRKVIFIPSIHDTDNQYQKRQKLKRCFYLWQITSAFRAISIEFREKLLTAC